MSKCGTLVVLALLFSASSSAGVWLSSNNGFCSEGSYPSTPWPEGKPKNIEVWGSYCEQGTRTVGSAISVPFTAQPSLALYLTGFPDSSGVNLALENLADHSKLSFKPQENPGARWLEYRFTLPREWIGNSVRLVATDNSTGPGGWLGFSQPVPAPVIWNFREAAILLLRTAAQFFLFVVPGFALCSYAVWRGVREVVVIGLIGLIGMAAPPYATFWLWLLSPRLGHAVSFLVPLLAALSLFFLLWRIGKPGRALLKPLLAPATFVFLSSLWILSAGFAYGGMRAPIAAAWTRFSHPLPPDNELPYLFAEGVRYSHVPRPLLGYWLSSDRPPLQTAVVLSQYPYLPRPRDLGYITLSVVLQSTWIFGLWILLTALEVSRNAIRLVLAVTLFWGFTLVNSFFVWPKLLAATYILGFLAIVLTESFAVQLRTSKLLAVMAGALLALGLLAHGGSAFALIGAFFTLLVRGRSVTISSLALIIVTCTVLYAPWTLYQKFYDPPGNHLLKLQLAGVAKSDDQSLLQELTKAYSKLTFGQWRDGRAQNFAMLMNQEIAYWYSVGTLIRSIPAGAGSAASHAAAELRAESFFYFAPNLGLLATGPLLLLVGLRRRYRTHEWRASTLLWTFVMCTLFAWCLLMFVPGSTSIHQGTYVSVLLASSGSILALWAVSRRLAYAVSAIQIGQATLMYGVFMRTSPLDDALLEGTVHYGTVALFFVAFALCWFALIRMPGQQVSARDLEEAPVLKPG